MQHVRRRLWASAIAVALTAGAAVLSGPVMPASAVSSTAGRATIASETAGRSQTTALWPTSFRAAQSAGDCGRWRLDADGFCVADDVRNGLEVGVRFETSQAVQVTGVRIYRVDPSTVTGSLWDASGTRLATGTFASRSASGWQDLIFDAPVTVVPGQTYVASYYTPKTRYAFEYGYFASAARTVGPITALRSTSAAPNGVHCYDDRACGSFPVRGFRDSTYWVSPLWSEAEQSPGAGTETAPVEAPVNAPRVVKVSPRQRSVAVRSPVRVTFSQAVRRTTLTRSSVRLVGRDGSRVRLRMSYDATRHRLTLRPARALRPGTTYRLAVTTEVTDERGTQLDQDPTRAGAQAGSWVVRTR